MRTREPFVELFDALRHLVPSDRHIGSVIELYPTHEDPERRILLREYFDDGKGHSGAFTERCTSVAPELFEQLVREGYVSGVLKPGYVSTQEFAVTMLGWEKLWRLQEERQQQQNDG